MDGRAEFGKRGRVERPQTQSSEQAGARDFERDRPMYERLQDETIQGLLIRWDEIRAHQESGHGISDDASARESIERQIRERYVALTQKS